MRQQKHYYKLKEYCFSFLPGTCETYSIKFYPNFKIMISSSLLLTAALRNRKIHKEFSISSQFVPKLITEGIVQEIMTQG